MRRSTCVHCLLVFTLLLLIAQSVNGAIPRVCYDRYIETGARPLEAGARPIDILTGCKVIAATARDGLSGPICTANSGMAYIDEFCETTCPEEKSVEECFCILGEYPNQFAYPGDRPPCIFPPEEDPVDEPQEEKQKGESCDGEGNPCSPASGNKYQKEIDYRSYNGQLEIVRHYNSLSPKDGVFGFGWTSTITRRLVFDETTQNRVSIEQANGRSETWINRDGDWIGDPDTLLRLEAGGTGFRLIHRSGEIENYDTSGRLLNTMSLQGQTANFTYDAEERLARVTGPFGRELNITYNTSNQIISVITPDGELHYDYDEVGNLASVTYPDGRAVTYHYEDANYPHNLTGITDENGTRYATWAYDSNGRVISSEHAGETDKVELTYNSDGSTTVSDMLGAERTYHFVTLHGVRKVQTIQGDPCKTCKNSDMRERTYDENGRLTGYIDWVGNQTRLSYNNRGLVQTRIEAVAEQEERTTTTEWHSEFNLPTQINKQDSSSTFTYDSTGRLLTRTISDSATNISSTYTYSYAPHGESGAGLLAAIDGPLPGNGDIIHYHYDSLGNLIAIGNALGHTTRITRHDPSGRPMVIEDPNGLVTSLSYDNRGRLIQQRLSNDASIRTTDYDYDAVGNLVQTTEPAGIRTTYFYDVAHHLIAIEDQLGNRVDYTLDAMGNRLTAQIRDPHGTLMRTQQWIYDQLSRLRQQLDSQQNNTEYSYDANGNLSQTFDPSRNATIHSYDALDRLIQTTDALNGITQYNYDVEDRLNSVTDPLGRTTHYEYDGLGNLILLSSPDTGTARYTYDEVGNRLSKHDARGIETSYTYDELYRLTAIHYRDSSKDVNFTYDQGSNGIGQLTGMSDGEGETDFIYNTFGEMIRKTRTSRDGIITTFTYAYDALGNLHSQTYPSGNTLLFSYSYGKLDGITLQKSDGTTQSLVTHLHYLPFGSIQSLQYGNGLILNRSYDQDYRMTEQLIPGLLENRYGHDLVGNIETWQDLLDNDREQQFSYDSLNRLTRATEGSSYTTGYRYDAIGNRLSTITMTGRTVISTTTMLPIYDEAGNAIQYRRGHYHYDDTNRMTAFNDQETEASYGYNGKGERVRKTVDGITTHFRYGQAGQLLGEYNQAGQPIREYIYLDGQPIALIRKQQSAPVTLLQSINLNHTAQTVDLGQHTTTPVIIASPLTYNGGQGAVAALNNITATQASVQVKEWDYLDGGHYPEDISLLALPPGRYPQADGSIWEVGHFTLSGTRQWHSISFNEIFEGTPYLFLTQQSQNDVETTSVRARNVSTTGFQAFMQEQESLNDGHSTETIGYLAIYSPNQGGTADLFGASFNYQLSQLSLNHTWTAQGDQELKIQEEASRNSELGHTTETLDILQIEGHLFAQDVTTNGWDTMALRRRGPTSSVLLSGNPIEQGVVYLHTDHLGAVVKATDSDQNLVWDAVRKPFGERAVTTAQIEMLLGFPGQYFDEETGNYYNYYRDYDPSTGRYIQSDPIGLAGGLNTYAYVGGNPLSFVDPFGLVKVCLYPEGANGLGHVGFGLPWDGGYTYGLYPSTNPVLSPGNILPDDHYFVSECIDYPSTQSQDQCMQKCRDDVRRNKEWYFLPTYSCYIFTHNCLNECGVTPWSIPSPFPNDAMYNSLNPSVGSGHGLGVSP